MRRLAIGISLVIAGCGDRVESGAQHGVIVYDAGISARAFQTLRADSIVIVGDVPVRRIKVVASPPTSEGAPE